MLCSGQKIFERNSSIMISNDVIIYIPGVRLEIKRKFHGIDYILFGILNSLYTHIGPRYDFAESITKRLKKLILPILDLL